MSQKSRSILEMTHLDARAFFLKDTSYCDIDLPKYFSFKNILEDVSDILADKTLKELRGANPRDFEKVNHRVLSNKDGRYAWRPLSIIHPAIYVALVQAMTSEESWQLIQNRFQTFGGLEKSKCLSIPRESLNDAKDKAAVILNWWTEVEQASLKLALDFSHVFHTDIENCYGSIYTHSISWALHTKDIAKENRTEKTFIGNQIDWFIQDMSFGQTNGIPQGSTVMDFIAEMILGFADLELSKKIQSENIDEYKIIRYRDDYRIFVNNPSDGDTILRCLVEVLSELGMCIKPTKTHSSSDVIIGALKPDKISWEKGIKRLKNVQKWLLLIYQHSLNFPNSGSLVTALHNYAVKFKLSRYTDPVVLLAIIVKIAGNNPRTYPICAEIISKLLSDMEPDLRLQNIEKIRRNFSKIPNTGIMEIWLQRITKTFDPTHEYSEPLCKIAQGDTHQSIWNNDWISSSSLRGVCEESILETQEELENACNDERIFNQDVFDEMPDMMTAEETHLFIIRFFRRYP